MRSRHICLVLLLVVGFGCSTNVTIANFEKIEPGMTRAQVEAILGPPDQVYQDIMTWKNGETRFISVVLDDRDLVSEKTMEGLQ